MMNIYICVYMINSEVKLCHASKKVLATLRRLRCDYEVCHYMCVVLYVLQY